MDLDYRNTPHEKLYRFGKGHFNSAWHQEQATAVVAANRWYAATFHFAWLVRNNSDSATFQDDLKSSLKELKSQFEQEGRSVAPHLAVVIQEALTHVAVEVSNRARNPAELTISESTANPAAYGVKRLQALLAGRKDTEVYYLGMKENRIGLSPEVDSRSGNPLVLTIEKKDRFAVLTNGEGRFLTANGEAVFLTDTLEEGSRWVIGKLLTTDLNAEEGWFSLESANAPDRFLRHYSLFVYAHQTSDLTPEQSALFTSDASWKFVDAE